MARVPAKDPRKIIFLILKDALSLGWCPHGDRAGVKREAGWVLDHLSDWLPLPPLLWALALVQKSPSNSPACTGSERLLSLCRLLELGVPARVFTHGQQGCNMVHAVCKIIWPFPVNLNIDFWFGDLTLTYLHKLSKTFYSHSYL